MAVVLCTDTDPLLLDTRKMILEQAGHTVISANDPSTVTAACKKWIFEVAVIGQATSSELKALIASLIRRHCPTAKILELYSVDHGKAFDDADSWLEILTDGPQELMARVAELANAQKRTRISA